MPLEAWEILRPIATEAVHPEVTAPEAPAVIVVEAVREAPAPLGVPAPRAAVPAVAAALEAEAAALEAVVPGAVVAVPVEVVLVVEVAPAAVAALVAEVPVEVAVVPAAIAEAPAVGTPVPKVMESNHDFQKKRG